MRPHRLRISSSYCVRALWLSFMILSLLCIGCRTAPEEISTAPASPISLLHHWSDVRIAGPSAPPELAPAAEIRFDGAGLEGVTWKTVNGIEELRVEDGKLKGRATHTAPVLLFELLQPVGTDDDLWSVTLTESVSDGTRAGIHPISEPGPPMPVIISRIKDWPLSTALTPSAGKTKTYSVELDRVFQLEMPPATRNIRQIAVRPTDVEGAEFAVESIRVTFRKERLATIPSGPGWHDLGEVFQETIVSRTPEALTFQVSLPSNPWLGLNVGTINSSTGKPSEAEGEDSLAFNVTVRADGQEPETVATQTVDVPETWHSMRVDLSQWAGQTVDLTLSAIHKPNNKQPGTLAFWGAPTVRSGLTELDGGERPQAVVVFLIDTLRSDRLDAWGHDRETAPTLSRIAAEGVRFTDAVSQATWTKVSVSSLLTSLYPSTTGVIDMNDRVAAGETTLAEVFREAGYATFATSSVPFSGQLSNLHQGVEVMHEFGALAGPGRGFGSKTARPWMDRYLEWLEDHRDVPTFALIHAMDPHSPFKPEPPYDTQWATAEDAERFEQQGKQVASHIKHPLLRRFLAPSQEELDAAGVDAESFVNHELAWYDGSIRALDDQLARLLEQWENHGLKDNSLLAVIADHGEEMLEHGKHWHGTTVYGEVSNVPIVMWGKGVPKGKLVEETVQNVDILPTLLELASLSTPERAQGRSLVAAMKGEPTGRTVPAFIESHARLDGEPGTYTSFAMIEEPWKLVWNLDAGKLVPEYELFDHRADPLDQTDLAADHPDIVEQMVGALQRWRAWAEAQRLDEEASVADMDAEQLEQLRSLGYIE